MKINKNRIELTSKEAMRIAEILETLASMDGNCEYDMDGNHDPEIAEFNKQCKDGQKYGEKLWSLADKINTESEYNKSHERSRGV